MIGLGDWTPTGAVADPLRRIIANSGIDSDPAIADAVTNIMNEAKEKMFKNSDSVLTAELQEEIKTTPHSVLEQLERIDEAVQARRKELKESDVSTEQFVYNDSVAHKYRGRTKAIAKLKTDIISANNKSAVNSALKAVGTLLADINC